MNAIPPLADVAPGTVLAGKYRVERVLGAGGMGVVVAAHHLQLDEKVALKFLLPESLKNAEAVARFVREARAAVKIKSEHVARVSDVGQLDSGSPYMVMEYLEGGDLAAWLKERGALGVELAVDFVLQACEAIAEAHALGIVHRDLKPANLFCVLRADGRLAIKVLDFGISKVTTPGAQGHDMTTTAAVVGSPNYMSPEQLQTSKSVDARTDVWSLGIILFELLTDHVPFQATSVTELVIKIATLPPLSLRGLRGDVPGELEHVVSRCLEKDRERRFANVGELALALERFGPKHSRSSLERILGTLRAAGISTSVPPPSGSHAVSFQQTPLHQSTGAPLTQATWGNTGPHPGARTSKTGLWIGMSLLGVALLGAVAIGGTVLSSKRTSSNAALMPATTSVPARSTAETLPSSSVTAAAMTAAVTSSADIPLLVATDLPAAGTPDAHVAPPPTGVRPASIPMALPARSIAPTALPVPPAPAANCAPNYTLDDQGRKHFKPECFLR
ncbi:MAG TPA: serine/threonine-protein kinase [Polyangiaceae bacterium]|jgi:serine/threonine-protein kinase